MKNALKLALEKREYTQLTPVQQDVSNPELEKSDLLVSAQTGSGKTVGFGLAIAPTLLGEAEAFAPAGAPLGLVIAPTRELALQVKRELNWLYAEAGVVMASCVGGMDMRDERRALERGAHIVVATPGRLRDHIMRGSIDLTAITAVVLDEADEMLDLGFSEDLELILSSTPETRRTLLFSATVPKGIAHLAKKYQSDAVRITTVAATSQHADIEYQAVEVSKHDGENAIINVLRYHEAPNAIIFANTRATVARLTTRLANRGFSVVSLSGELSQSERSHALQAMRDGRARICVATDVAARGIDLPKLDLVIHAELPSNHETLLHRSGRTGRAGRKGTSVLIVAPNVRRKAERILGSAKVTAEWRSAPSADDVIAKDHERMLQDDVWNIPIEPQHQGMIAQLLDLHGAERVAAAFLATYSSRFSAPEDINSVVSQPPARREKKTHEDFGPSTWFKLAKGRDDGLSPGQIVPMLCSAGDITKADIGAIRLQGDHTFVELRQSAQDGFVAAIGPNASVEGTAIEALSIEALSYVPDIPPAPRQRPSRPSGKPAFAGKPKEHRKGGATSTKSNKPAYEAKERKPKSRAAKELPEDVVTPLRKKAERHSDAPRTEQPRNSKAPHKSKSAPTGAGLAPKKGKFNSKKNKARRAEAQHQGGGGAAPRRK